MAKSNLWWAGRVMTAALVGCVPMAAAQTSPAAPPASTPAKAPKAPAKPPAKPPTQPTAVGPAVLAQAREAWSSWIQAEQTRTGAEEKVASLDALVAWCALNLPASEVEAWPEVVASWRLAKATSALKDDSRSRIAASLAKLPLAVRVELGLLIRTGDKLATAVAIAESLSTQVKTEQNAAGAPAPGRTALPWASVIAAMAVVHDEPFVMQVNGLRASAAAPDRLFAYFLANQRRLSTDLANMPPRLAVMVVDAPASVSELEWALNRYAGQTNIKPRYSEVPYDNNALRTGEPVKAAAGWSLQSCLKGGVCAHQAYFASTVGKALGVPAAYVVADGADMGHAWLGYLKVGGQAAWDFDTGRYDDYENARGEIRDPQTGQTISDGRVAMSAGLMSLHPDARRVSEALAWVSLVPTTPGSATLSGLTPPPAVRPRPTGLAGTLALLDESLRLSPRSTVAWDAMAVASRGFSPQQRIEWSTRLMQATSACPDYALDVLGAMVEGLPDGDEKIDIWDRVARSFASSRKDLAAEARLRQAWAMHRANRPDAAWGVYQMVIAENVNDGPAVIDALMQCERMLEIRKKGESALDLYAGAYAKARRPKGGAASQFNMGSNWARIAMRFHKLLTDAGRTREAENVMSALRSVNIGR